MYPCVCAKCSMRHIFKPEEAMVEFDEDGRALRVYHVNCMPDAGKLPATALQFTLAGYDPEMAEKMSERENGRRFQAATEQVEPNYYVMPNNIRVLSVDAQNVPNVYAISDATMLAPADASDSEKEVAS
jgi:hypothetical protein